MENYRKQKAIELFKQGYNCTQAILLAYCDLVDLDEKTAFKISTGFGGGIAKLGKTCGAINAAVMLISLRYAGTEKTGNCSYPRDCVDLSDGHAVLWTFWQSCFHYEFQAFGRRKI